MATVNGTHTPPVGPAHASSPAPADSGDKKRKREDSETPATMAPLAYPSRSEQNQSDILQILEQYDTSSSFLKHTIEHESTVSERSPKKARLSASNHAPSTIASNLSSGAYTSLDDLKKDAARVSASVVSSIRAKAKDREGQNGRLLVDDLKQMQRAQAFEQVVKDVVEQEAKYDAMHQDGGGVVKEENKDVPNGTGAHASGGATGRTGIVLTLPGNAPTAKQLFSSMQRPVPGRVETAAGGELAIDEVSLPIGITATKIMSAPVDEKKSGPTFEETFPAPYSLPTLHPPRAHRRSTTRDETIRWEFRDLMTSRNKKGGYTVQSLPVGDWLGYGGVESKDEPSSPREKRKLRDRTLSSGESTQPPPSRESLEEALWKEEEALFRKAYSSFAPSCDNSKAIISQEVKSMVWWHKVGQKRYQETFAIDPALVDEPITPLSASLLPPTTTAEVDFSTVVEDFEALEEEMPEDESTRDKTNIDEVLHEISELLHTLSSYQRIRNATLQSSTSATRTPISPAPTIASRIGRPGAPGEDEVTTYEALRRELAYIILQLPPYAVAKVNGDQLAELGVSKIIALEGKNMKGTMEEDQVARLARYTAQAAAQGLANLTRSTSGTQHYSSTNQRTPAIGQAANTRYGQTQYGLGRTPMTQPQFNRSISNQGAFNTPSATAPRPGYGQPNQYSRPGATQSGFGQANGQQYYQRQLSQVTPGFYNQFNNSTPTNQHQRPSYPSASSQPLAQFQQRSQSAAQNAVAYQTAQSHAQQQQSPLNRSASPLKPANYQPPLQPSPVPRPGQQFQPPASDRATPVNYPSQPQTPVNGVSQKSVAARTSETPQPQPAQSGQASDQA